MMPFSDVSITQVKQNTEVNKDESNYLIASTTPMIIKMITIKLSKVGVKVLDRIIIIERVS